MGSLGKSLMILGGILILVGGILTFGTKIPLLGRLPGDIHIKKEHFELFIPLTTGIVLSVIVSAAFWLINLLGKK